MAIDKDDTLEQAIGQAPSSRRNERQGGRITQSDTQSFPELAEEVEDIQAPYPQQHDRQASGVRELRPQSHVPPVPPRTQKEHSSRLMPNIKKGFLVAFCFVVALSLGFGLACMARDQSAAQQAERQQQEQRLKSREEKLLSQEAELREERDNLEKQKQEMERRQQELANEASRLQGRNERLQEEDTDSQGLGRFMDKLTGKDKQRQDAVRENRAQSEKIESDITQVRGSIKEAQAMLDELDSQLSKVEAMQQEVEALRRQAEKTYQENKGTIDMLTELLGKGAAIMDSLLAE